MSAFAMYQNNTKGSKSKHSSKKANIVAINAIIGEVELLPKNDGHPNNVSSTVNSKIIIKKSKKKRTGDILRIDAEENEINLPEENGKIKQKKKSKHASDNNRNDDTKVTQQSNLQDEEQINHKTKKKSKKRKRELDSSVDAENLTSKQIKEVDPNDTLTITNRTKENSTGQNSFIENNTECASSKGERFLEKLLYPIKTNQFFETYWETEPLMIERNCLEYYKNMLGSKDIDNMLRDNSLYFGRNVDIVVYQDGVRTTLNPVGRAIPSIVWDAYEQGHSVRILNPQTYNDNIHMILSTLQEYFGTMVGANVYLTPAGSQGFAPHYDDIEAFIVQLEGRKYWKLYKPRFDSDHLARTSSKDFTREELGEPIYEGALNAGDILYFPRGTVHEAKTDSEMHSLHLTISTYQKTSYADLIEEMVSKALKLAAKDDIEFRKGLPVGYLKHLGLTNCDKQTQERTNVLNQCRNLMLKLINYSSVDDAADELGRKFMHDSLPPILSPSECACTSREDGFVLENGTVTNKNSLQLTTSIRLLRYYGCRFVVDQENNQGILYFSTQNSRAYHQEEEQMIEVDMSFGPVIEVLLNHYPKFIQIDALPHEDKEGLINFLTELWDYEIITTKRPLAIEN